MTTTTSQTPPAGGAGAGAAALQLADQPLRQECVVVVQTGVRIGGALYETASQLVVRKIRQQAAAQGGIIELSTLDFAQEPNNELEELAGYLAQVKSRLLIEVDRTGCLQRVLNKEELLAKWQALKPNLEARYRTSADVTPQLLHQVGEVLNGNGRLEEALGQAPDYRLLLPVVFDQPYSHATSQPGTTTLKRFLGDLDLAILTEARWAAPAGAAAATLEVRGWVDKARYPAAGVGQAVRALSPRAEMPPALHLLYHETYSLGSAPGQGIQHAASHTHYEVPGVVGREVTALLSTVTR